MAWQNSVVAVRLQSHIDECGQRYEASREAIRDAKADLTADICQLRVDQQTMDERNRKAITGVFQLLWAVAGGVILLLVAVAGVLAKAELHISG